MKVMTSKTEARGLQSRTEVRQTVAQMAAPNFKDSAPEDSPGQVMAFPRQTPTLLRANSYFAPSKLVLCSVQTRTLLRVKSRFASGKLLARRAAMLLILMIGMVGSAWGQTFNGTLAGNGKTHPYYLGTGVLSPLNLNVLDYVSLSEIVSDMTEVAGTSITQDDLKSNLYVRWCIEKDDATLMTLDQYNACKAKWGFENQQGGTWYGKYGESNKFYIFAQQYYEARNTWLPADNFSPLFNAKITFINTGWGETGTLDDFAGYKIVCYVGRYAASDISLNLYGESTLVTEPTNFDIRYEFLPGKKPDTFSGSLKGTGQALSGGAVVGTADQLTTSVISATLDFSAALAEASSSTYVRFYLEKDGEAVDPTDKLKVTGGTAGPDKEHGFYIYKSGGLSSTDVDNDVTLELTAGEYEDYQVVAVFGNGEPSGDPLHEVDWDLQYKYTFEYPFKGDASSATKVEKTFTITESKKTQTLTMAFDIADNKITLTDASANELGTATVDASSFWSAIGSSLSGSQPFYVRWFLQDKSGAEATSLASAGAIVDGGSSLYAAPAKNRYGLYFSTANGTNALNDIMKIKVYGSKVSDLAKYDLVCTIATDLTGEGFDGSSKLTHEPNAMVLKYVLKFEDAEWAGALAPGVKSHSKEVLIPTASTTEIVVPLSDSFAKILSENISKTPTGLDDNFHIRWYVEKLNGSVYEMVPNSEDMLAPIVSNRYHKTKPGYGVYWNTLTAFNSYGTDSHDIIPNDFSTKSTTEVKELLNIHFTKPSADSWSNYRLVAVMTKDLTGSSAYPTTGERTLEKEPTTLDILYYFKFFVEDEFQFVHDKGASGRNYITATDDSRIAGTVQQYNWDNDTSMKEAVSGDVRQGVHTVEYNIYVDPSSNTPVKLHLPFEKYYDTGNNLEPTAYIRWYDWATDMNNSRLAAVGTYLESMEEAAGSRGLFMLNNSKHGIQPIHSLVGVTFNPNGLTSTVTIACDVSKYYDGIYQSSVDDSRTDFSGLKKPYLMHEPTLSTRYLINIHPASDVVGQIKAGQIQFEAKGSNMFDALYENNGRVSVSIKDRSTKFAVRAQLVSLSDYYVYDGSNNLVNGSKITWKAFYEDETGYWEREGALSANGDKRIVDFAVSNLDGTYTKVGGSDTKSLAADAGMRFHLVGLIGDGTTMVPVVHYEINLFSAPAYHMDSRPLERTEEYLKEHMDLQATLDFDSYLGLTTDITSQELNHTDSPLPWDEAQYGFCYPQVDEYRIYTQGDGTDYSGLSPIHGDYMLLKSMNKSGISENDVTHAYKYHWWANEPLLDYTYLHGSENKGKYGTFLYVDASDESRTIAKLKFNANLCAGSELCFTAAISDMTHNTIDPQVMATVYAVQKGTGKRVRVVSFLSSELNTTLVKVSPLHDTYTQGSWFQFYGKITIPDDDNIKNAISAVNLDHYEVDIDNYALNTNGADYCVDQLQFYTNTGKLKVEQTGGACEGEDLSLTTYISAEQLESKMTLSESTPKTIYYRIFRKTGTTSSGQILYEPYPDASIYGNGGNNYGQVSVYKYALASDGTLDVTQTTRNAGYYFGTDGILNFKVVDDRVYNLEQGFEYFFTLTESLESPDVNYWADPNDPCDVFSQFFVPKKTFVSFVDGSGNDASMTINSSCSGSASLAVDYSISVSVPDANVASGFKKISSLKFDFFKGTSAELRSGGAWEDLLPALQAYRNYETTNSLEYKNYLHEDFKNYNESYYNILKSAIEADKLEMSASTSFQRTITETTDFLAIPVTLTVDGSTICSIIPFTFTVNSSGGMPTLTLGFDDVDYSSAGTKRVLRVGLEQLNKMRTQGYKLHIPVNSYSDKNQVMTNKLYFPTDAYLTISAVDKSATTLVPNTTDPTKPAIGTKFAKIVPNNISDTRPSVDKDHMYISLDLSGENCAINFHEGYEYEVATTFVDASDEGSSEACIGDLFLVIKVVPEFVTWHAQHVDDSGNPTTTETDYWSANWYNDGNWQRSVRSDLYKDTKGSSQNTATKGHPNGYDDNGEGDLNSLTAGSNPGFVPMKFTYVTLPTGNNAPSLINEPRVVGTGKGAKRQGGGFLDLTRTTLLTDRSPNANTESTPLASRHNSKPTENIYYDMLVRYSKDDDDQYGEGCFGHRYLKSDGTWDDQGTEDLTARVFDVEKFQGNVCREIYFKPGAELLRPHRLQYEKAWVEMELDANKWYLVSAPLKDTYAGDMYVPTSMTDVTSGFTVKGRQVTEAFQSIGFDKLKGYSRTQYPIYQRSWGNNNGTVYVMENDIRANSYSANLNFSTVTTSMAEWGHTFNDVQVPYNTLTGFSIRAHRKDQTDKVLIRLPKADTSYGYFDWSDAASDPAAGTGVKTVSKTNINKLVSDYQDDTDTETSPLTFNISVMQQIGDYVLVGNPFMVSIDMNKFFATNSTLGNDGYWTYEGSNASAHAIPAQAKTAAGIIKPLQAFFVKKGSATQIVFNKEMQIDGNFPTPPTSGSGNTRAAEAPALTLSASNGYGSSSASVEVREKASADYVGSEDVETLFDSNLADVPMVFTVAGRQAVSIDARPSLDVVPFGVACAASDELVDVSVDVSYLSTLNSQLFVLDAVTGEVTEMYDGQTVSVQPNDYGRYFLTTRGGLTAIQEAKGGNGIVVSVRNKTLTVRSDAGLKAVRIVTVGGETVASAADCGTEASFALANSGVYIVEAQTASGGKTMKAVVR